MKINKIKINISELATHVVKSINTAALSEEGREALHDSILYKYPFKEFYAEEYTSYEIARDITMNVMKELIMSSLAWYEKVHDCIDDYIIEKFNENGDGDAE